MLKLLRIGVDRSFFRHLIDSNHRALLADQRRQFGADTLQQRPELAYAAAKANLSPLQPGAVEDAIHEQGQLLQSFANGRDMAPGFRWIVDVIEPVKRFRG